MNRTAVYVPLLAALSLVAGVVIGGRGNRGRMQSADRPPAGPGSAPKDSGSRDAEVSPAHATELKRQLELLASKLAAEAQERRHLEARLDLLAAQLAALRGSGDEHGHAAAASSTNATTGAVADPKSGAEGLTGMERALIAAGVDATTASDIKRREDQLALSTVYLRDQATREGWMHTPRFAEEMAKIDQQRTPLRDEIGDDAYDRYLAALDQPNRVAVNEVLSDSPAAAAGLQAGDVVLRYGDTRIFAPRDLVNATRSGVAGETVQVELLRAGQRLQIDVPRGPLGVSIAASRGAPAG
jgi:membrane-associated protease RseP (regulator of RpoE activity)